MILHSPLNHGELTLNIFFLRLRTEKCSLQFVSTFNLRTCTGCISDSKLNIENELIIYPNPANDILTIQVKLDVKSEARINILNVLGDNIFISKNNLSDTNSFTEVINLKQLNISKLLLEQK